MSVAQVALVWLLMLVTPGGDAQRTYQRHCECEYFVDGRCAYTLLLPTTTQGEMSCPLSNSSAAAGRLLDDVSALRTWTGEQAKALVTLQNSVSTLAAAVRRLDGSEGAGNGPSDAMDALKMAVDQLNRTVVELTALCRGRCADDRLGTDSNSTALERRLVDKYRLCALRGLIDASEILYSSQSASTNSTNFTDVWCPSGTGGECLSLLFLFVGHPSIAPC